MYPFQPGVLPSKGTWRDMGIHLIEAPNASQLYDKVLDRLIWGSPASGDIDIIYSTEVGISNMELYVPSFEWDFDLKLAWVGESRWNMMVRQYLDRDSLETWLDNIELAAKIKRGTPILRTNLVKAQKTGRQVRRRWGSCMLSIGFQLHPKPVIHLTSRTTYFGYLAALDMTVAHVLARYAAKIVGVAVEDIGFRWSIDLGLFHGYRCISYPMVEGHYEQAKAECETRATISTKPNSDGPGGWRKTLDALVRIQRQDDAGKLYGDEKFSSFCRIRRRLHTEVLGLEYASQFNGGVRDVKAFDPLPSIPIDMLNFSTLYGKACLGDETEDDDD